MNTLVLETSQTPQHRFAIRRLHAAQPLSWLRSGFDDLIAAPVIGLLYGVAVAALALLLVSLTVGLNRFYGQS
ncbi:hypothetical protein [Halochromatium roseum]|uniref:hypothetical protein n=1 Tax=Halochromatium roseum TaxID=391920 RepID=UPI0019131B42|nr:hypothetical protein [Halochromatium roseum]